MTHSDIITLEEAKDYLALDDTSRDNEVLRMVKSAISWVQKRTDHVLVSKSKAYDLDEGCVRVYDFPIGAVPTGFNETVKSTYSVIFADDWDAHESVTLPVGYANFDDVPEDLVEACYLMLKFFFYEQEGSGKIPLSVLEIADHYKRFII